MPNDLTRNELPEKQISPVLSPDLKRLLDAEPDEAFAVAQIAKHMAYREEARAMLPVLKAAAVQRAGKVGVMEVIGKRFALYPQPDRSDAEWAAWWEAYIDTLEDVSWAALDAGMAAWVKNPASEFMPKPGQLLDLANGTPNRAARSYWRAQQALGVAAANEVVDAAFPRPKPTDDEVAAVKDLLAGFRAKIAERDLTRVRAVDLPSTAGKPDEGGITKEMRALLARRTA